MTNRYDKLSELNDRDDESRGGADDWIQAPDGSWIRSSDKVAKKLVKKGKLKVPEPAPQPARAATPPPAPPAPAAPAAPPAEPKRRSSRRSEPEPQTRPEPETRTSRRAEPEPQTRPEPVIPTLAEPVVAAAPSGVKRLFGRKSAAEKQRQAELEQVELDRQAEIQRRADDERRAERERERKAELRRQADIELQAELEREAELERQAELERRRQDELRRQAELELERRAEQERQRKAEQERAQLADFEREVERELERQAQLRGDAPQYYSESDKILERWPETRSDRPAEPGHWQPEVKPKKAPKSAGKPAAKPKEQRKHESQRGPVSVGERIVTVAIAAGLVLATLAIGAAINWLGPDPDRAQRPFAKSGETGKSIDVRTFTITVQTARAAATLQSGQSAQDTQGAWVIVHIRLIANTEPMHIGYAALRDGAGRTYLASDRLKQPLLDGTRTFQPGIPMEGEVVFEVPKDALNGLTALFAARPDKLGLDAMASVGLPQLSITAGQPPATLAATEVKP